MEQNSLTLWEVVLTFEFYQKLRNHPDPCSHDLCKWGVLLVVVVSVHLEH